jgi:hypothetical protein
MQLPVPSFLASQLQSPYVTQHHLLQPELPQMLVNYDTQVITDTAESIL